MLTDSSIDGVMAIDSDWRIIAWNKTSELISGLSKADVLGKSLPTDILAISSIGSQKTTLTDVNLNDVYTEAVSKLVL